MPRCTWDCAGCRARDPWGRGVVASWNCPECALDRQSVLAHRRRHHLARAGNRRAGWVAGAGRQARVARGRRAVGGPGGAAEPRGLGGALWYRRVDSGEPHAHPAPALAHRCGRAHRFERRRGGEYRGGERAPGHPESARPARTARTIAPGAARRGAAAPRGPRLDRVARGGRRRTAAAAAPGAPGPSSSTGTRGAGCALALRRGAPGRGRAGDLAVARRAGAGGARRASRARYTRVSRRGRAGAAGRARRRAARGAGAARSGGLRHGPGHRCRGARRPGAPPGPGVRALSFARPFLLLALGVLPLWWWLRTKRLSRLSGTRMSDVRPAAGAAERLWIARLPVTLRSACLGAWIIAAAGPRVGAAKSESRSEGISIVLAIDMSSSMLAEDFAPANRIDVAKQTAIEFVRARTSDRIGLVAFAAQALTQVPLTTDYQVLEQAIRDLKIGMPEYGTGIGTGIGTAASRLRRSPGKSKVIVLLTDGVNNRGTVDPRPAAQAAAAFGIKIYVIGVGKRGEAPVPTGQGADGLRYEMMLVEIDEPLMTEIASMTGGRYFRATDSESLRHIFPEVNRLEKSSVEQVGYRRFEEAYRVPLAVGLVALALEIVLAGTFAVRVP